MAQSIDHLELDPATRAALAQGGIATVQALRDATAPQLWACGLDAGAAHEAFALCDEWLERRFRGEVLFPMLPESCQYVECAYLELEPDVLVRLAELGVQYLYQLAMSRRDRLAARLEAEMAAIEGALARFQQSYRQGDIDLQIEENDDD